MSKVCKRLLIFFIGLPVVLLLVFCDIFHQLPLQITITVFSALGGMEFYDMLSKDNKLFPKPFIIIATAFMPFITYIFMATGVSLSVLPWIFICESVLIMGIEGFSAKTFEFSLNKIAKTIFIIFYAGYFITFLSRMSALPNPKYIISLFLIFVFMCDSGAWFFGILFGKSTRGIFAASPNKSLVGFIGGIITSIACGIVFKLIFPEVVTCSYLNIVILGFITALAAIIGDLIESVFKRSCGVKDSGHIIPGRGGVLDSIDSVLVAAPIFYVGQYFLF